MLRYWVITFMPLLFTACSSDKLCNCEDDLLPSDMKVVDVDLEEIKEKGYLTALTTYSSTSYFIYRGQPMGYEYELLERLTDYLDVELDLQVAEDLDSMMYLLNSGQVDIIAHGLTITKPRKTLINFTEPHNTTQQVLVQRKPDNWNQMKLHEIEDQIIRNPVDLIGDTIHIRRNSAYYNRIRNLSDEIGGDIHVAFVPGNSTTDEIIRKVALGEYKYTVADQNIADINQTYYPIIDTKTQISFPARIAWGVRKTSEKLLAEVNTWLKQMKKEPDFYVIYDKYFENSKSFQVRVKSDFYSKTGGRISRYDPMIRDYAQELTWDWRLLASQIFQESKFNPKTTSWAGAKGLMQVMPATGKQFGITNLYNPTQNMEAGVSYMNYLSNYWQVIPDSTERVKFILASYNVGPGHVEDARRLAEKYGKNPFLWDANVAEYLLLKSKPKYYNDEVAYYGYCRGTEPYNYVKDIINRFNHYARFILAEEDVRLALSD